MARCTDCSTPLCGVDLRRRGGKVLCADDLQKCEREEQDNAFRASLDKLAARLSARTDPTERALLLYVAPNLNRYVGQPLQPEELQLANATLAPLFTSPSPAFTYRTDTASVELTSTEALTSWAFAHPNAPAPVNLRLIKVLTWLRYTKLNRGSVRALRLRAGSYEGPTGDFQVGSSEPPVYLLEDGRPVSCYDETLTVDELTRIPSGMPDRYRWGFWPRHEVCGWLAGILGLSPGR